MISVLEPQSGAKEEAEAEEEGGEAAEAEEKE